MKRRNPSQNAIHLAGKACYNWNTRVRQTHTLNKKEGITILNKKCKYIITFSVICVIILICNMAAVRKKEENSAMLLYGILKLNTSRGIIVDLGESTANCNFFLSKSISGSSAIKKMMETTGWKYVDHQGAAYIFTRNGERAIMTERRYAKNYILWKWQKPAK